MQEQPSHNSLWFLISRSLSGEATALEEAQLKTILHQDFSLQQQYELLKRMWHSRDKHLENTREEEEEEKENISRILGLAKAAVIPSEEIPVIQTRSRRKLLYALTSIAAIFILAILFWLYSGTTEKMTESAETANTQKLVAENGSRTRTILPDGSIVLLNAGSHISFSENFSGAAREVTLDGEAYFDVVKQPDRPFIVHVSGYDIRVLGTVFNVKSYATDKTVETTLLQGIVQVTKHGKTKQEPILLRPNEKLIVDKIAAN